MRTLRRYITWSYLLTFLMALVVFTFVLCIGVLFKATDLLARGVPWRPIVFLALCGVPGALSFSLPLSALTSALLLFGRLSADGEITAMKACGVNMARIAAGPLAVALCLAAFCLYINNDLAPRGHYARRSMRAELGGMSPADMIDEGRFIQDFAGFTVYVGKRRGERLQDIRIYEMRVNGQRREIRAHSGTVGTSASGDDLCIELQDVRIDPFIEGRPGAGFCESWTVTIPGAMAAREYRKRHKDMTMGELAAVVADVDAHFPDLGWRDRLTHRMAVLVELNKRLVLSVFCFTFVVLGIPLGIKAHRKESSLGVAMSLVLVLFFYSFVILAESLRKHPGVPAHVIVWVPVAVALAAGMVLMRRAN